MFTLDTNKPKPNKQALKTAVVYLAVSIFCIGFNRVYATFSHGVSSASMTYMFLYPLLGGVLPFALLWLSAKRVANVRHYRFSYNCYNSGLAALTLGSLLSGIMEIAGTASPFLIAYTLLGWGLLGTGLIVLALHRKTAFDQSNLNRK